MAHRDLSSMSFLFFLMKLMVICAYIRLKRERYLMTRNYTYDLLKVIALICILLAHVNPPGVIFQLRNFDVPLMILISVWLSYTRYI